MEREKDSGRAANTS